MYIAYEALAQTEPEELRNCTEAHPLTFKATADPDMMYLHEALKQPDREQFLKAMDDEIEAHCQGKHWNVFLGVRYKKENLSYQQYGQ